jgi:allantoinase
MLLAIMGLAVSGGPAHSADNTDCMINRDPDLVDESFREYAINWGIERVGRLFKEQPQPLSLALNAQFPEQRAAVWKALRSLVPDVPIIARGLNNSTELLPHGRGLEAQTANIRHTLDLIEKYTRVRS